MSLDRSSRGDERRDAGIRERHGPSPAITPRELRLLAEIEDGIRLEDPRLAARLTAGRRERVRLHLRAHRAVLSLVGALGGMVLMVLCFASLLPVALIGAAMFSASIGAQAQPVARAVRRLACRVARLGIERHHPGG